MSERGGPPRAAPPVLVVVTGGPGIGKTSVASELSRALGLALFTKDGVKEILFDTVGWGDRELSGRLGLASITLLVDVAARVLASGGSAVVEADFDARRSGPRLREVVDAAGARVVQVVLVAEPEAMVQRFAERAASGERHPGHLDADLVEELAETAGEPYVPLDLPGPTIVVDTTDLDHLDTAEVVARVVAALDG